MARSFRGAGPRRKTQWGGFGRADGAALFPTQVTLAAGSSAIIANGIAIAGSTGVSGEEITVTRTIGVVTASIDATTAEGEATVGIGCIVARGEAITAGVGSLPSVESDMDAEWLYYAVFMLRNPANTLQDGVISSRTVHFDVRGQRIVRAGSGIVWIAQANFTDCQVGVCGRYLVKLT